MGLFSFLKRNHDEPKEGLATADLELIAPCSGVLIPLKEVPDLVISEKLMGDGVAIMPEDSTTTINSPCTGIITRLTASNNAFAIRSENGIETYVTLGIGQQNFLGKGLSSKLNIGDKVFSGQAVIDVDMQSFKPTVESVVLSMIVISTSADIEQVMSASGDAKSAETICTWVKLEAKDI